MTSLQETIEYAKGEFLQAKERLLAGLATTPDDRINWAPSPTARTPVQLVAHAAWAVRSINETLDGRTFQAPSVAEADRSFRDWEQQFTTRDEVLALLDQNGAAYLAWLDTLTPERLEASVEMPFNLGPAPLSLALTFVPAHTRYHVAQLDYLQTIYGDHDWHM